MNDEDDDNDEEGGKKKEGSQEKSVRLLDYACGTGVGRSFLSHLLGTLSPSPSPFTPEPSDPQVASSC